MKPEERDFQESTSCNSLTSKLCSWVYTFFTISVADPSQPPRTEAQSLELPDAYFKWRGSLIIFFPGVYFLFPQGIFCYWLPPFHLLSRAQGWHRAGVHFLREKFVSNLKFTLLVMNKPSILAPSHALLLCELGMWPTSLAWEVALPSPATFLWPSSPETSMFLLLPVCSSPHHPSK